MTHRLLWAIQILIVRLLPALNGSRNDGKGMGRGTPLPFFYSQQQPAPQLSQSLLNSMANLLEVSESGSTSEEEDLVDGFVVVEKDEQDEEPPAAPKVKPGLRANLNASSTSSMSNPRPSPPAAGSLSRSTSQIRTGSGSSLSSSQNSSQTRCSGGGTGIAILYHSGSEKISKHLVYEDFTRSDSASGTTPKMSARLGGSSDGMGGSGSGGVFAMSRSSRLTDSSQFSPALSSSGVQVKRQFILGRTEVADLLSTNGLYVDRSRWVQVLLTQTSRASIILRPRLFGKTTAINVARLYFDHQYATGRSLELQMHRQCYNQEHAWKYCVLVVEWKRAPGVMQASRSAEFRAALVGYLGSLLAGVMRRYGKTERDVPYELQTRYRFLSGSFPPTDPIHWTDALALLVELASSFASRPVILFVDDYDAPIFKAYALNQLDALGSFFSGLYTRALSLDESLLFKAAIFGVHRLHDAFPFRQCRCRFYAMGEEPFHADFGFSSGPDIIHIHSNYSNAPLILTKDLVEAFGGYPCGATAAQQGNTIMLPYSVAKSFQWGRVDWTNGYSHIFLDFEVFPFKQLASSGLADLYRPLKANEPIKDASPICHVDLFKSSPQPPMSALLVYLRYEGLLNYTSSGKEAVPVNENARKSLIQAVVAWFDQRYKTRDIWHDSAYSGLEDFKMGLQNAWNKRYFSQGLPACYSFDNESFLSLLMHSAERFGYIVPDFEKYAAFILEATKPEDAKDGAEPGEASLLVETLESLKQLRLVRFVTDKGESLLVMLSWTASQQVDERHAKIGLEQAGKLYRRQMASSQADYPPLHSRVGVIFCKNRPEPIVVSSASSSSS